MGSGPSGMMVVQQCMKGTLQVCSKRVKKNYSTSAGYVNLSKIGILGAPMHRGQRKPGVEEGPKVIRTAGVVDKLKSLGHDVFDYGDLAFEDVPSNQDGKIIDNLYCGQALKTVYENVRKVLLDNRKCITLGGDHSISIGTVFAHASVHRDISVIWIDAHADINTPKTSPSGNIHGMPLSFLIEEMQQYTVLSRGFEWVQPCVKKNNVAYIGLRDVDDYEKFILNKLGIPNYSMAEVDRLGILKVIEEVLYAINPRGNRSLHVSFDIDALDKTLVPCTGTPVCGGLTLREAAVIAEEVSRTGTLNVLDIVEVNPKLGNPEDIEKTAENASRIISHFFGSERCGKVPLTVDYSLFPLAKSSEDKEVGQSRAA